MKKQRQIECHQRGQGQNWFPPERLQCSAVVTKRPRVLRGLDNFEGPKSLDILVVGVLIEAASVLLTAHPKSLWDIANIYELGVGRPLQTL